MRTTLCPLCSRSSRCFVSFDQGYQTGVVNRAGEIGKKHWYHMTKRLQATESVLLKLLHQALKVQTPLREHMHTAGLSQRRIWNHTKRLTPCSEKCTLGIFKSSAHFAKLAKAHQVANSRPNVNLQKNPRSNRRKTKNNSSLSLLVGLTRFRRSLEPADQSPVQTTSSGQLCTHIQLRRPSNIKLNFPSKTFLRQTKKVDPSGPLPAHCLQLLQSEPAEFKYIETKLQTTLTG